MTAVVGERSLAPVRPAVVVESLVLGAGDLDRAAAFWSALLGLDVVRREADHTDLGHLGVGGPVLRLRREPDRARRADRPSLDLRVEDFRRASATARLLGAVPASRVYDLRRPWQDFSDPEGNRFRLLSA